MLLSTIICPQYLRGWGSVVVSVYAIIPAIPLVVYRHIYALHHPPHHHIQREERDSHIATLFIRPYAKRPYSREKVLLLYYLIVILERNTLYFSTLDALYMNPKGSQAFRFNIFGGHLRHILDIPWTRLAALTIG